MRKVIGMGETIMDIIFHGAQPTAAVPGGSSFNSIISIGPGTEDCFRHRQDSESRLEDECHLEVIIGF